MYLPVESFGRIYMQADNWHTDAVGYDLIAHAVVAGIERPLDGPRLRVGVDKHPVDEAQRPRGERSREVLVVRRDDERAALASEVASSAPSSVRRSGSSDAVGSSSSSTCGSTASARAMATRWASPPDSSRGSAAAR